MSKITAIEIQKKDKERCSLFIDGEFFSGVSLETVIKHHLKVGDEIEKSKLTEILHLSEKEKALSKALNYLSKTIKTRKQVKDYLIGKEFLEEIVFSVLDKLTEYGLLNDREYCIRYIETYSKTQGRKLIEYKLMSKGVKKEDVLFAFNETENKIDNFTNAYNLAIKHLKGKAKTRENLAKTYRYLAGKGYLFEDIERVFSKIREEE